MANNTTSFQEDSSSSGANEDHRLWLNDEDFTTVMIVTVSGMLVLGIFLILCLVRFPSYDTIENLLHDKRSFRHEWSPDLSLRSFKLHRYLGTTNRLRHEGRDYLKYPFFDRAYFSALHFCKTNFSIVLKEKREKTFEMTKKVYFVALKPVRSEEFKGSHRMI